jgi:glycosyltransferase involved in cell wall biosynthesis
VKICVLTHNYPRFPGDISGTFIEALSEQLARLGQEVHVLAPYDPRFARRPEDSQVVLHTYRYIWPARYHRLGYMQTMQGDVAMKRSAFVLSPFLYLFGFLALWQLVRRERPAVIHAHWVLPNGFIAALVSHLTRTPLVVSLPGSDVFVAGRNALFRWMARFAFGRAALLTANSADLRDAAVTLGADSARFTLIIYGVDPDMLRPDDTGVAELRRRLGLDGATVVLAVGRFVYKKGFDVLIRAMSTLVKEHPRVQAVLVGDGDLREEWEALARRLGVTEQVLFVGTVPRDQISVYYNMADIFVMPSVVRPADGLNVCVVDALACGLPVVASDVAGNPLVVRDGENGYLVPQGDAAALAAALGRLAAAPELRRSFGQRARQMAVEEFSWRTLARQYAALFNDIMESRLSPPPCGGAGGTWRREPVRDADISG